jgi:hypothetical protein
VIQRHAKPASASHQLRQGPASPHVTAAWGASGHNEPAQVARRQSGEAKLWAIRWVWSFYRAGWPGQQLPPPEQCPPVPEGAIPPARPRPAARSAMRGCVATARACVRPHHPVLRCPPGLPTASQTANNQPSHLAAGRWHCASVSVGGRRSYACKDHPRRGLGPFISIVNPSSLSASPAGTQRQQRLHSARARGQVAHA